MIVILPLLLLSGLEGILRLTGTGYETGFWKKSPVEGVEFFIPNATFRYRFFPRELARAPLPQRVAVEKPGNTFRLVLFGGSAAYGDPDPVYGLARRLKILLQHRLPGSTTRSRQQSDDNDPFPNRTGHRERTAEGFWHGFWYFSIKLYFQSCG